MATETKATGKMTEREMIDFVMKYVQAVCIQQESAILNAHAENSLISSGQEPGNPMSRNDFVRYIEERQWAFPDFHFEATNIKAFPAKNIATFEWKVNGTFKNPMKGMQPNGRHVTHQGTTELEIVNGKIVRETSFQDKKAFLAQLVAPPVGDANKPTNA
jgi:predicted ester cyclase